MVVYLTSGNDATRLLQGQYFHIAGESAYTNVFEQRARPKQCCKCQELGHMAFSCQKAQVCAKCACAGPGSSMLELGYEDLAEQIEVSLKLPSTHLSRAIGYRIKENAESRGNSAQLRGRTS
jgi:hypothetical protein